MASETGLHMATEVVMPQMGESIAEGTIVRWIKKVGDKVDRDEPLFEISTDKVDAEIPSPAAGVLAEIRAKEGETVPVNSIVAVIGAAGEAKADPAAQTPTAPAAKPVEPPEPTATDRRRHPAAVLSARSQDRERAPRRHLAAARQRNRRPRDEGGHPAVHRAGGTARVGTVCLRRAEDGRGYGATRSTSLVASGGTPARAGRARRRRE